MKFYKEIKELLEGRVNFKTCEFRGGLCELRVGLNDTELLIMDLKKMWNEDVEACEATEVLTGRFTSREICGTEEELVRDIERTIAICFNEITDIIALNEEYFFKL